MNPCVVCELGCESDTILCEICDVKCVHVDCLGVVPQQASTGTVSWRCTACSNFSLPSLLSRLMVKMDVVDHLAADIVNIKETLSQIAPKDPYLNALSKDLDKSANVFKHVPRDRIESNASDKSERKKRKLRNQQVDPEQNTGECSLLANADVGNQHESAGRVKKHVRQVAVVNGTSSTSSQLAGVELKQRYNPRRHYFVSRVSSNVDQDALMKYCETKMLSPIACRELPSRRADVKSFHLILPEDKSELAEQSETWPQHVILRRYFMNDEARSWIKTLNAPSSE